jgi:protein-S-isoprenylcysteine O-methyltransferase Ste14
MATASSWRLHLDELGQSEPTAIKAAIRSATSAMSRFSQARARKIDSCIVPVRPRSEPGSGPDSKAVPGRFVGGDRGLRQRAGTGGLPSGTARRLETRYKGTGQGHWPRALAMTLTPRLALFTLAGTLAYLGLAVIGGGGFAAFFARPPLLALTFAFLVLAGAALFSRANLSPGEREDRSNRWVIAAIGLIGTLSAFLPAYTDRKDFWTFDGDTIRWIGVALFVAGGALRLWPVFVLGPRFSGLVAIQPGHTLVTDGVYGVIRHPSYLGLLINALGWALAFRSGVGVLLAALLIPPILARIGAEERLLMSQFGSEYDAYRRRTTWRLVPGLY